MTHFPSRFAEATPDAPALVDDTGSSSWTEVNRRTNQLVHALRAAGLGPGDVIAIFAGNSRSYFEIMLAANHAGIVYVPVNWHFSAEELAYVIADSGARLLFTDDRYGDIAAEALARGETPALAAAIMTGAERPEFQTYEAFLATQPASEPEDQCLGGPMFYTSGTTGRPKGVKSSTNPPGGPLAVMEMMGAGMTGMLGIPAGGTTLLCGPVYHSAQWAFSFLPLLAGNRVVMQHKFDAAGVLKLIDAERVTNVHLVPTQFHRLLRLPEAVRRAFRGDSLQAVWHGAAPCPPAVKQQMIDWWGPVVSEYYGSTEGSIVTTASSTDWQERPGTVGKPTPLVEVSIRTDTGERLGPGESGQIYVKSLMGSDFEYHNEPGKTADVHLEPGTYTFGDIGYLDTDGYLYLSDRKIDMIISGGVNIYPAEIEGVLLQHPAVEDAAVFGIPNEEYGEEVKAAVTLHAGYRAGTDLAAELAAHCREHLAGYKTPRSFDFPESMPRTDTGKLYKRLLRAPYWENQAGNI